MLLRATYIALLFAAGFANAREQSLTFRSSWLEIGENGHAITAEYVVIESVDLESFASLHYPDLCGLERVRKVEQLEGRALRARKLIEDLGARYKQKAARHGALTPSYEADIDRRINLAKQGKARLVALLGHDTDGLEQQEVFAMAAIFPDFGEGVLLQADREPVLRRSPDIGKPTKERVRIFGSGEARYLDENIQLGELASNTELYWGDTAAIGLFTVPRDKFHVPGCFGWSPTNGSQCQVVDWKAILLNLAIADGLVRFGERSVPDGSYEVPMSAEHRSMRQRALSEVGKAPYLPPELVGAGPQTKIGISRVILFTRSETLAELMYKPMGASLSGTRVFAGDGALQYDMEISREDLEAIALEKFRNSIRASNPYFGRIQVTPNFTYERSPAADCRHAILFASRNRQ